MAVMFSLFLFAQMKKKMPNKLKYLLSLTLDCELDLICLVSIVNEKQSSVELLLSGATYICKVD